MADIGNWIVQLLSFAATAGVISGGLSHFLNQREINKQRHDASAYTAIRLAVIFEHFADDCSDVVSWNANVAASKGATGEDITAVPRLGQFPGEDDGWKMLSPDLLNEALSFPQRIKMADGIIKSAFDYAEHSDAVRETTEQCVLLGSRAWQLALRLRAVYGFAPLALEFPFETNFLDKLPAIRERRKAFGSREH